MPNLTAARAVAGVIEPDHGLMKNMKAARATLALSAADLTLNALHSMFRLPRNAVVVGGLFRSDDLDSNGAPAILMTVGDAGNAARYFASTSIGQTGGVTAALAAAGAFFKTATETVVTVTIAAAPATPQAGSIDLSLFYYVDI
jgi:hypothetical protein